MEAYFHGTPEVIGRDETEWRGLADQGWAELCAPTDSDTIVTTAKRSVDVVGDTTAFPYGHGDCARQITQILKDTLWARTPR